MQARFILGPAGSGKTFRCLAEIRAELAAEAEGPPLILLAPKQATFQLERQLLAEGSVQGFTRLRILSFERLARFILVELGQPLPSWLDEEGRIMVLRALLARKRDELRLFRSSARLPGFAQHLSMLFREFQRHHVSPDKLLAIADRCADAGSLQAKLRDFALLLRAYAGWLESRGLRDADALLDVATAALHTAHRAPHTAFRITGLWLDGFAEMTPQELELLAAVLPLCERATLAFCLEDEPKEELSWLSTWAAVGQTFRRCRHRIAALAGCETRVEILRRDEQSSRFARSPPLRHIESHWSRPLAFRRPHPPAKDALRIVCCPDPEAEAVLAAREVHRFVRQGRGRFRDCAVLLRSADGHQDLLRRAFKRYEIPFFLDRRESVAHHPLAELTRAALRLAAFGWQHDDWFGALKTGLVPAKDDDVDWLENEALARGWTADAWRQTVAVPDKPDVAVRAERLRSRWTPPFLRFEAALRDNAVAGSRLTAAIRLLWDELGVAARLEEWAAAPLQPDHAGNPALSPAAHATVWEQMQAWLENAERAFQSESLPLREWLPVLDAGLASLTVGVVPPSLDQVLIGTIDRSRNPELKLAVLLGLNEGVFPARPQPGALLTDAERERLESHGARLGPGARLQLGHERYYGYIACTRASERLVAAFSRRASDGEPLNASPFVSHLLRLFPSLQIEEEPAARGWTNAEHASELAAALVKQAPLAGGSPIGRVIASSPAAGELAAPLLRLPGEPADGRLSPEIAAALHGPVLRASVSSLEQFAACPFRFFVHAGLRAEERRLFELDARERGSFQHEVLAQFHHQLAAEGKRWRDVTPAEARERIGRAADEVAARYGGGLMRGSDESLFTARSLRAALQEFIEVVVGWMRAGYEFDPVAVELAFGNDGDPLPAWEIDLGGGCKLAFRGKIDRVDVAMDRDQGRAWCVVVDYKSSARSIDTALLAAGVQIQLPAYLAALCRVADATALAGADRLEPAALCYASLRGAHERNGSRAEALAEIEQKRPAAFRHTGRLNQEALRWLDAQGAGGRPGGQFNYRLKNDGTPHGGSKEIMPGALFRELLSGVEDCLRAMGRGIFAGDVSVDPYRRGHATPCERCDYRGICRIDPWTHEFRALKAVAAAGARENNAGQPQPPA